MMMKRSAALAAFALYAFSPAQAQENMKVLTAAAFEKPGLAWFDPRSCAASPGDVIHVNIGLSTLKIPAALFSGGPVGKIDRMGSDAKGNTTWLFPPNIGCAERPASFKSFTLSPVPEIDSKSILIESSAAEQRALDVQLVSWRDTGKCRQINPELYACEGVRYDFGDRARVGYLISADPKITNTAGAPLRARCFFPNDKPVCSVVENIEGGLQFTTGIVGPPSLNHIARARQQSITYVNSLRVKTN